MATFFSYTCDNCGYCVHTSGPHEFYRDSEGNRKPYGHPSPLSEEAEERGIWGLSAFVYCVQCDEEFEIILVEYEEPSGTSTDFWLGEHTPKDEYKDEKPITCPKCGGSQVLPYHGEEVVCPRCQRGKLIAGDFLVS